MQGHSARFGHTDVARIKILQYNIYSPVSVEVLSETHNYSFSKLSLSPSKTVV